MKLKKINLLNFRNYEKMDFVPSSKVTVFFGKNGQGKTNIIESVFLCSTGKSHRTQKYNEMIKYGEQKFTVNIETEQNDFEKDIIFDYDFNAGRTVTINDIPIKKIGELMGCCSTVLFCPEDLSIIRDGPAFRRRFFDIAISQLKPAYFYNLQKYKNIVSQKNAFLKEAYKKAVGNYNLLDQSDKIMFDVWNEGLSNLGAQIIYQRLDYLKIFNGFVHTRHYGISNCAENIQVQYQNEFNDHDLSEADIAKQFKILLEDNSKREFEQHTCLIGPHRDDYPVLLNDKEIRKYGSQGQKRTAVLAFKLAETDTFYEYMNYYPILLLDDVLSELDDDRRKYLFDNLDKNQVFITGTSKDDFKGFNDTVEFVEVQNGKCG